MIEIHYEDSPDTVSCIVFTVKIDEDTYRMAVETSAPNYSARWFKMDSRYPNSGVPIDDVDQHRTLNEIAGVIEVYA